MGGGAVTVKVSAGDVEHRVDIDLSFILPDIREGDVLSMAEEPGCFVVE
jgi:regulator of RNase E activity RraA